MNQQPQLVREKDTQVAFDVRHGIVSASHMRGCLWHLESKSGVSSLARKHCPDCDMSRNLRMAPSLADAVFSVKRELTVNVCCFVLGSLTGGSQTKEPMWDLKP